MKKGLGRGLEVLFEENESRESGDGEQGGVLSVSISDIEPNSGQPRKFFDEEKLAELSASIKEHGVITPLIVSPIGGGRYRIIAGERRWRAARIAGLHELPVVVRDADDREIMEVSLIENLQREDLNIIEEAEGYRRLADEFGLTQEEIATRVGKSRPVITNALRLLSLPAGVVELLAKGRLSLAQGKSLLSCGDEGTVCSLAARAADEGLTVRELEALIKKAAQGAREKVEKPDDDGRLYFAPLEERVSGALGRKATISGTADKGRVMLEYYSSQDLDTLIALLADIVQ